MKARGSAIIIAMLLITAIGSIAFGISHVLFIESASASTYVNGAVAYYAAESGLEEGFLRYRYNQNAEVPFGSWNLNPANAFVYRSNLTNSSTANGAIITDVGIASSVLVTDASKQFYDLRMGYLGTLGKPLYGHDVNYVDNLGVYLVANHAFATVYGTSEGSFINVNKDDSIKLDLSNVNLLGNANHQLLLSLFFSGADADKCHATAEVKFVVKDAVSNTYEYKGLTSYDRTNCSGVLGVATSNLVAAENTGNSDSGNFHYMVSNIFTNMLMQYGKSPETNYQKVTMFIKPLFYNAKIGLATDGCNTVSPSCSLSDRTVLVPGPYSSITTTGYYGGTTRKLEANIDRQSGTLYDLFDYVIYKNS
ncbi:MAG: hypothetical protein M1324_02390 [Patescibacteria group bacterium]|nr:hypothetical protein [Patescibacteria group bacterium]